MCLRYPQKHNPAAIHNFAVGQARGEYVLLLNAFAVITQADWLDELLNHAQRPEVGVVGAKLFDPDGGVLHAGLILGLQGPAGLPFFGQPMQSEGYMFRLQAVQDLSAVGGDCLMIRKSVFEEVAGLDEQDLKERVQRRRSVPARRSRRLSGGVESACRDWLWARARLPWQPAKSNNSTSASRMRFISAGCRRLRAIRPTTSTLHYRVSGPATLASNRVC